MEDFLALAQRNAQRAAEIIGQTDIVGIWRSVGAEAGLVGSVQTGLMMKNRDIDFHIYSSPVTVEAGFRAMSMLAENPAIGHIEYTNLLSTAEECIEWHAWYTDNCGDKWQIDMIHIQRGSQYDGYFERVADRIAAVLTPDTRKAILKLKWLTPAEDKIYGIEYYKAVLDGGVTEWDEFVEWRKRNPITGIVEWMP